MKNILIIIMVTVFITGCNKSNRIEPTNSVGPTQVIQKVVGNVTNEDALALIPAQYFTQGKKIIFKDIDGNELTFVIEEISERNVPWETDELKYSYDETVIFLVSEDQEKVLRISANGSYSAKDNAERNLFDIMFINKGNTLGDILNIELSEGVMIKETWTRFSENLVLNNVNFTNVYYLPSFPANNGAGDIPFANIRFNTMFGVLAFDDLSNVTWYYDRME